MQPDWAGVCPHTIEQARRVAGRDFVVFMADMFRAGYGAKRKTFDELMTASRALHNDLEFTVKGGRKALEVMLEEGGRLGLVDPARTAAVGYCAGGGLALELARTGAKLGAVVVFHVTHPDPVTPKPAIHALEDELTAAGASWQTVMFGAGTHSFTDPTANTPGRSMYDAALAARSYALMRDYLAETC